MPSETFTECRYFQRIIFVLSGWIDLDYREVVSLACLTKEITDLFFLKPK